MIRIKLVNVPKEKTEEIVVEDSWEIFRTHCDRGDWSLLLIQQDKTIQRPSKGKTSQDQD